jgi:hypothetical protein
MASTLLVLGLFSKPWSVSSQDPPPTRRVNVPTWSVGAPAIFWFGEVNATSNYADVRLVYTEEYVEVFVHIIDRLLWKDLEPTTPTLTDWDAVTLYLDLDGNSGQVPDANAYRFVTQLNGWEPNDLYQAGYRGNGSTWVEAPGLFTARSEWRGNGFNDEIDDKGWEAYLTVHFASLGLDGPPADGTTWGLSVVVHDRDDAAGTTIPDQFWPEIMEPNIPDTWGQMVFGIPSYHPPAAIPQGTTTIRQGLDGASVIDGHVGGHTTCGDGLDHWAEWGEANYAGYEQINIQNQWDIADYPCFSKYYVTFPLDALPPEKLVISATLTMYLFGNAGGGVWGDPPDSYIQMLSIGEDWDEASLSWNSAPLAVENTTGTWVHPVDFYDPGVPYRWDVSRVVAQAHAAGGPLRLALYSADGERHSGKYFWSADADQSLRPTLQVLWADPLYEVMADPSLQSIEAGGVTTYMIQVQHSQGFTPTVTLQVGPSPSPSLAIELAPPTSFDPPGGQTILTLRDLHDPSLEDGLLYTVPITASGGGITQTTSVKLLVNGTQICLPLTIRSH